MKQLAEINATLARIGYIKPASGTWGSAAAVALAWAIYEHTGFVMVVIATLLVFIAGWWATKEMTDGAKDHDPSEIVIDEVVGQWIALFPVLYGARMMGVEATALWPGWLAAFVLFRLFDIWKPLWIGKADRRGDALGVMLDDVIAGVFAAVFVILLAGLSHGLLMP